MLTIKDKAAALRRVYPNISRRNARFLYGDVSDLKRRGKKIIVLAVLWSSDGRVSMHSTVFSKERPMSVAEWGGWLQVHAPGIFTGSVLAYANRTFGSTWNIDRVFGWHFASRRRK